VHSPTPKCWSFPHFQFDSAVNQISKKQQEKAGNIVKLETVNA
jgi:hypothetical protein